MPSANRWEGTRAVFFDAVGTVLHPEPAAAQVYAAVGQRHGSRLTAPEIARRFRDAFLRQELHDRTAGLRTSEARERERWRQIVAEVLDDVSDPGDCFRSLYEHFARPEAWRCTPGTAEVLRSLSGRGILLGLASNYDRRLRRVVRGLPELRPISALVISSEVGWRKPAPPFFTGLCQLVRLLPAQILFVGDDRENDYLGATANQLRAVLFDPGEQEVDASVARIKRLADLRTLRP
jgi:putative hydrolase of the HAD superfamily